MSNDLIITPQSQLEVSEDSISRFVNYYLNHLDIRKVSKVKYKNYLNQFLSWLKALHTSIKRKPVCKIRVIIA